MRVVAISFYSPHPRPLPKGARELLFPMRCLEAALGTSRRHFTLPGLFVQEIQTLPPDDARTFVLTVADRIGNAADELCRLCGYLPLALRVSASTLAERPGLTLDDYLRRLGDIQQRLQLTQVDATLTLSLNLLSADQQRQFCALAVFPDTFEPLGVAAVWDLDPDPAHDALDTLMGYSLVDWNEDTKRYRLHDLARDFAALQQINADRAVNQERHAEHYKSVLAAVNYLYLQGGEYISRAVALFDLEVENIQTGHTWAVAHAETHPTATRLSLDYPFAGAHVLDLRQHPQERIAWLETAVTAARTLGDRLGEGTVLGNLGLAYADLGELPKAIDHHQQRLGIAREIGDRRGEGQALGNLGLAYAVLGEVPKAIDHYQQDLVIAREIGNRRGEGTVLGNLGLAYADLGEVPKAIDYYQQALAIACEIGDRRGEGQALGNLGLAYADLGEVPKAIDHYQQALAIFQQIQDPNANRVQQLLDELRTA